MTTLRPSFAPVLALLLSLGGCDPDSVSDKTVATPKKTASTPKGQDATKSPADTKAGDFAACMAGCIEGKPQSPTDRHTCRLTCGADRLSEDGPGPSPATKAALARFETCNDADCTGDSKDTNAATCRLTCAQTALAGSTLTGQTRGCAVSCLDEVGDCELACPRSADEAATCRLQCQTTGQRCLGQCEVDPTAPRSAPPAAPPPADAKPPAEVSVPKQTRDALPNPSPSPPADAKGEDSVPPKTRKTLPTPP